MDAMSGPVFHLELASQDLVLLELLGLDPGVYGLGVLTFALRCGKVGQFNCWGFPDSCRRRRGVIQFGVQAVEAAAFVDRAPLAHLGDGNFAVDLCRPALTDDRGAGDLALLQPLRDTRRTDVAHFGKFGLADDWQGEIQIR